MSCQLTRAPARAPMLGVPCSTSRNNTLTPTAVAQAVEGEAPSPSLNSLIVSARRIIGDDLAGTFPPRAIDMAVRKSLRCV